MSQRVFSAKPYERERSSDQSALSGFGANVANIYYGISARIQKLVGVKRSTMHYLKTELLTRGHTRFRASRKPRYAIRQKAEAIYQNKQLLRQMSRIVGNAHP